MKKRVVTAMLAAMMVFSTTTTALAVDGSSSGGSISADAEAKSPVYKVSVPTSLSLYIDPFNLLGNGQVTSSDFGIINKSNVAISVEASIGLTGGTGVDFKTTDSDVTNTTANKLVFVQAEIPHAVSETSALTPSNYLDTEDWKTELTLYKDTAVDSGNKYYLNKTDAGTETPVTAEMTDTTKVIGTYDTADSTNDQQVVLDATKDNVLVFALDKAVYTKVYDNADDSTTEKSAFRNVATSQAGSAVFRFTGKVNTKANWQDADIKADIAYTFNGLTDDEYTTEKGKITTASNKGHAFVTSKTVVNPVFTAGATVGLIEYTNGTGDGELDKILNIEMANSFGTFDAYNKLDGYWEAADDDGNGNITLKSEAIALFNTNATTKATITYTTKGGSTRTATINVKTK